MARSIPEVFYKNSGISESKGSYGHGQLANAYLIPFRGENFTYFSPLSYYILDNAYLHSSVYQAILEAYEQFLKSCPGTYFRIMECSRKKGGKMRIHRTHPHGNLGLYGSNIKR
jgi:penicillin-insensitive murein endopeptidase